MGLWESRGRKENKGYRERQAPKVHKEKEGVRVRRESKGRLARLVKRERRETPVLRAKSARRGQWVLHRRSQLGRWNPGRQPK